MFRHLIDLDRMLTHMVMVYESKIEVVPTCGPMDRLRMPHLVINDFVKHRLHHHGHVG